MDLNEYQRLALRTAPPNVSKEHDLWHGVLGISSEAGELADALKKPHAYGKVLDRINVIEEVGDVLWYCAILCRALDVSLTEIACLNIAKLTKRYPEKFSETHAVNRDLESERKVLEGM